MQQPPHVEMCRKIVKKFLQSLEAGEPPTYAHKRRTIVELGGCDITGYFSWGHHVHVWETDANSVAVLVRQYPWAHLHAEDFAQVDPMPCDLLMLSPKMGLEDVYTRWLGVARHGLVCSALEDLRRFVELGKHEVQEATQFGKEKIVLSKRRADATDGENQALE